MKKKLTYLFILIPLICGAVHLSSYFADRKVPESDKETVNTSSEKATLSQDGLSSMDYRNKVEDYQLKLENEICISENQMGSDKISYSVISCYSSKDMTEDVKNNIDNFDSGYELLKKKYTENVFTEEGKIEGNYSYLYVEITVECMDNDISMFTPLTFQLLELDNNIVTDYYGLEYESAKFVAEMDEMDLIDYKKTISPFKAGNDCSFILVFIVPDEVIKDNKMCLNYGFGKYGKQLLNDNTQEYVKLYMAEK